MCDACNGDWPSWVDLLDEDEDEHGPFPTTHAEWISERNTSALLRFSCHVEEFYEHNQAIELGAAADAFGNIRLARAEENDPS